MIRLLSLIMMTLPFMALADGYAPALPALFDVSGVTSDDTLTVRLEPNGSAPIIDRLAHDATELEVVMLSLEGNWAYISRGEQSGWVARRYLAQQLGKKDSFGLPPTLTCFGTEPFWTLTIGPNGLTLFRPDSSATYPITATSPSAENVALNTSGFRFAWSDGDSKVQAHILPGLCNDGMSDAVYGLHYVDNRMLNKGCCSL